MQDRLVAIPNGCRVIFEKPEFVQLVLKEGAGVWFFPTPVSRQILKLTPQKYISFDSESRALSNGIGFVPYSLKTGEIIFADFAGFWCFLGVV